MREIIWIYWMKEEKERGEEGGLKNPLHVGNTVIK